MKRESVGSNSLVTNTLGNVVSSWDTDTTTTTTTTTDTSSQLVVLCPFCLGDVAVTQTQQTLLQQPLGGQPIVGIGAGQGQQPQPGGGGGGGSSGGGVGGVGAGGLGVVGGGQPGGQTQAGDGALHPNITGRTERGRTRAASISPKKALQNEVAEEPDIYSQLSAAQLSVLAHLEICLAFEPPSPQQQHFDLPPPHSLHVPLLSIPPSISSSHQHHQSPASLFHSRKPGEEPLLICEFCEELLLFEQLREHYFECLLLAEDPLEQSSLFSSKELPSSVQRHLIPSSRIPHPSAASTSSSFSSSSSSAASFSTSATVVASSSYPSINLSSSSSSSNLIPSLATNNTSGFNTSGNKLSPTTSNPSMPLESPTRVSALPQLQLPPESAKHSSSPSPSNPSSPSSSSSSATPSSTLSSSSTASTSSALRTSGTTDKDKKSWWLLRNKSDEPLVLLPLTEVKDKQKVAVICLENGSYLRPTREGKVFADESATSALNHHHFTLRKKDEHRFYLGIDGGKYLWKKKSLGLQADNLILITGKKASSKTLAIDGKGSEVIVLDAPTGAGGPPSLLTPSSSSTTGIVSPSAISSSGPAPAPVRLRLVWTLNAYISPQPSS